MFARHPDEHRSYTHFRGLRVTTGNFLHEALDEYPQWQTWQVGISRDPWSEDGADVDTYEVVMRDVPEGCFDPARIDGGTGQHVPFYYLKG